MVLTQCLISVQCRWYSKNPFSPKSFLKRQFLPSHILPFWLFFSSGTELQTAWAMCLDVMKSYLKTMQKYQILQQLWQQQWQKQPKVYNVQVSLNLKWFTLHSSFWCSSRAMICSTVHHSTGQEMQTHTHTHTHTHKQCEVKHNVYNFTHTQQSKLPKSKWNNYAVTEYSAELMLLHLVVCPCATR